MDGHLTPCRSNRPKVEPSFARTAYGEKAFGKITTILPKVNNQESDSGMTL